ncbi:cupin domain-containing protein [Fodinibius halophilus]|uniref:cupin domain-containing protein n=1 Tax=Fodinibius halophilus TaxID=1736908 RepID=UPI00197AEA1F|nr:cupin domain-containing protein [Fodinibius halophilus]
MKVVSKEVSEHYNWGDHCDGWHLLKNPQLSIIQEQMPPDTKEVKHYHVESEQFFFVLSGKIAIEINDKVHTLNTEVGMHIPAQQAH